MLQALDRVLSYILSNLPNIPANIPGYVLSFTTKEPESQRDYINLPKILVNNGKHPDFTSSGGRLVKSFAFSDT